MGAGNRYTLEEDNNELAYFVDASCDCWEQEEADCYCWEDTKYFIVECLSSLPLATPWDNDSLYYGDMYKIVLRVGNYDEIVIDLDYQETELYGLQAYNYTKVYYKIIKHLNKFMPLMMGHGWTSSNYAINELV